MSTAKLIVWSAIAVVILIAVTRASMLIRDEIIYRRWVKGVKSRNDLP